MHVDDELAEVGVGIVISFIANHKEKIKPGHDRGGDVDVVLEGL